MDFYLCGSCGDYSKWRKAKKHALICRNSSFSCRFCNEDLGDISRTKHICSGSKNTIIKDKIRRYLEGNKDISPSHQKIICDMLLMRRFATNKARLAKCLHFNFNISDQQSINSIWNIISLALSANENTTTVTPETGSKEHKAQDKSNLLEEASGSGKQSKEKSENINVNESYLDVKVNDGHKIQDGEEQDERDIKEENEKNPFTSSQKESKFLRSSGEMPLEYSNGETPHRPYKNGGSSSLPNSTSLCKLYVSMPRECFSLKDMKDRLMAMGGDNLVCKCRRSTKVNSTPFEVYGPIKILKKMNNPNLWEEGVVLNLSYKFILPKDFHEDDFLSEQMISKVKDETADLAMDYSEFRMCQRVNCSEITENVYKHMIDKHADSFPEEALTELKKVSRKREEEIYKKYKEMSKEEKKRNSSALTNDNSDCGEDSNSPTSSPVANSSFLKSVYNPGSKNSSASKTSILGSLYCTTNRAISQLESNSQPSTCEATANVPQSFDSSVRKTKKSYANGIDHPNKHRKRLASMDDTSSVDSNAKSSVSSSNIKTESSVDEGYKQQLPEVTSTSFQDVASNIVEAPPLNVTVKREKMEEDVEQPLFPDNVSASVEKNGVEKDTPKLKKVKREVASPSTEKEEKNVPDSPGKSPTKKKPKKNKTEKVKKAKKTSKVKVVRIKTEKIDIVDIVSDDEETSNSNGTDTQVLDKNELLMTFMLSENIVCVLNQFYFINTLKNDVNMCHILQQIILVMMYIKINNISFLCSLKVAEVLCAKEQSGHVIIDIRNGKDSVKFTKAEYTYIDKFVKLVRPVINNDPYGYLFTDKFKKPLSYELARNAIKACWSQSNALQSAEDILQLDCSS